MENYTHVWLQGNVRVLRCDKCSVLIPNFADDVERHNNFHAMLTIVLNNPRVMA